MAKFGIWRILGVGLIGSLTYYFFDIKKQRTLNFVVRYQGES